MFRGKRNEKHQRRLETSVQNRRKTYQAAKGREFIRKERVIKWGQVRG